MKNHDSIPSGTTLPYFCSSCSRWFVAFGAVAAGDILCMCGAPLQQRPMLRGLYEVRPAASEDEIPTNPGHGPIPKEPDVGYGASHGYDASHGGPTGPGDAPADVAEGTL